MRFDPVFAQDAVGGLARRDIALVTDEILSDELAHVDLVQLGQSVFGRHDEDHLVVTKGDRDDLAAFGGISDNAKVDLSVDQVFVNLVRAQVLQMDVDLWISAEKFRQIRG